MRSCTLFLLLSVIMACNDATEKTTPPATEDTSPVSGFDTTASPTQPAKDDGLVKPVIKDSVPFNIQIDTVIHISFAKDSSQVSLKGSLNKDGDPVICYLPVKGKQKLDARLIPHDNNLNIRFSQIYMPDQSSDGPFSRQLKYKLDQEGTYKIIIGPNRMADGKRSGDFVIKISVTDQ